MRQRAGYVYIGALLKGEIEPTKLCRLCATDDPELPLITHIDIGVMAHDACETRIRALSERAVSPLKAWRLLRRLRCSTTRITDLTRAVLTLHHNAG